VTDLFGKRGRQLLDGVALAEHEREQIDSALRLHDALQNEIERADRELARCSLERDEVRRLMTIPGLGAVTALSLDRLDPLHRHRPRVLPALRPVHQLRHARRGVP